ncbi:hypothetical protein PHMEG_00024536 [Phytophthora megakarya]|uniref:Tyr recombinase domain-containing protein n=1 Tax=Phytophthora megakarya TaxID=4795 RepID=A0A225VFY7_9STRA|nr:hypothetical protein PHMEG_00024536 [Phytophthora megakarya]
MKRQTGNQYPTIQTKLSSHRFLSCYSMVLNANLIRSRRSFRLHPHFSGFFFVRFAWISRDTVFYGAAFPSAIFSCFGALSIYSSVNSAISTLSKRRAPFFSDGCGNPVSEDVATAVIIGLGGAKNDQYGRGALRTMHRSGDRLLCPVLALKYLLHARQGLGFAQHQHLCADLMSKAVAGVLKKATRRAVVEPSNYSTHSLRSGGPTALLSGKGDSLSIKLLGRWISRCFEECPLQNATATTDLSQRMISLTNISSVQASTLGVARHALERG